MDVNEKSGCAVLAGGAGRRMGKRNKAELNFAGRSFLTGICSEFEKAGFKGYISVAHFDQKAPEGWVPVRDTVTGTGGEFIGPIGGICSCLKQAGRDGLKGLFFAPCDAPFYNSGIIRILADRIGRETECDAAMFRTPDGRLQTTFGWYSISCIETMERFIADGIYKIIDILSRLKTIVIETADLPLDEKIFRNINSAEEYSKIVRERKKKRHILICGKRQAGKTTLIQRVIRDAGKPVCGFITKASVPDESGVRHIYMYPAGISNAAVASLKMTSDNHIGDTCGKVLAVNTEVFDRLGASLIRKADTDGILIMDELGFMEENAHEFRGAVLAALDSDVPVLAAVKDTDKECGFLETVRAHPDAELLMINRENRDELFRYVRDIVSEW